MSNKPKKPFIFSVPSSPKGMVRVYTVDDYRINQIAEVPQSFMKDCVLEIRKIDVERIPLDREYSQDVEDAVNEGLEG